MKRIQQRICLSLFVGSLIISSAPLYASAAENNTGIIESEKAAVSEPGVNVQDETAAKMPRVLPSTVRELFDAEYYRLLYQDLSVLGDDPDALYDHFIKYGLKEGRKCSPYLDLAKYISENEDLKEAFGENTDAYVAHYFRCGMTEGRNSYATEFDRYLQNVLKSKENPDRKLYGQALLDFSLAKVKTSNVVSTDSSDSQPSVNTEIQVHEDTIIVPWDYVANGYVTLDMIKAHCGDNLILVQNQQGDVTFLAGDISSKSVSDSASALETVKSMFGVLKLDDETNLYLSLICVRTDSEGNSIYEFSPMDQESGRYATTITDVKEAAAASSGRYQAVVRIKAGSDGTVIALTSTSEDSYTRYQELNDDHKVIDSRSETVSKELSAKIKDKYEILGEYTRNYQNTMFYKGEFFVKNKEDGTIGILDYDYENGSEIFYKIDPEIYETSGGKDSYPLDYLFSKASYENMTLTDYFGNEVTVPVAHMTTAEGESIYYLASKEDNTLMFIHSGSSGQDDEASSYSFDNLVKLSMGEDGKLSPVNTSLNMGDLVSMYSYILEARRYFRSVDPVKSDSEPFIINYNYQNYTVNAFGGDSNGVMHMTYENSYFLKTYDTAFHESTHSMTANQYFNSYTNYNGAISEGYADIIGLCMQQKKYDELVNDYMSKHEGVSLTDAKTYVNSHFGDFSETWYASYYKDGNGSIEYLYDADDPCNNHMKGVEYATSVGDSMFGYCSIPGYPTYDNYNCHANSSVLSHIAYEMYKSGIVTNVEELATIWYDSMNYITGESEFYDVRYYVEESMKEHGYGKEAIEATDRLFTDSNVTLETRDKNLLATPENLKAENNLAAETAGTVLKLQKSNQESDEAARVSDSIEEIETEKEEAAEDVSSEAAMDASETSSTEAAEDISSEEAINASETSSSEQIVSEVYTSEESDLTEDHTLVEQDFSKEETNEEEIQSITEEKSNEEEIQSLTEEEQNDGEEFQPAA